MREAGRTSKQCNSLGRRRLFSSPVFEATRRLAMNSVILVVIGAIVLVLVILALSAIRVVQQRAKVIHAQGELLASTQLAQAAAVIGSQPAALQLRYLQT